MNRCRCALTLLIISTPAAALEAESFSSAPSSSARVSTVRLRFGAGYWGGVAILSTGDRYPLLEHGFFGGSVEVGVQLNDNFAVLAFGRGSAGLFSTLSSAGTLAELTLAHWFSVSAGFGATATYSAFGVPGIVSGENGGIAVGVPFRLSVNFGHEPDTATRHRFYFAIDGWLGTGVAGQAKGFGGYFGAGLGYSMM